MTAETDRSKNRAICMLVFSELTQMSALLTFLMSPVMRPIFLPDAPLTLYRWDPDSRRGVGVLNFPSPTGWSLIAVSCFLSSSFWLTKLSASTAARVLFVPNQKRKMNAPMAPLIDKPRRFPLKFLLSVGKNEKIRNTGNRAIRSQQIRLVA